MNQNFKRVLPTIFTGIALLFSFINLIFLIVLKDDLYVDAWDYVTTVFVFLSIGGLLAIAILELLNRQVPIAVYFAPLGVYALSFLLYGFESLININKSYSSSRYINFNSFIAYIYTIAIIGLLIYAICKKKATLAAISISYFIFDYFIAGLKAFNQIFFAIFSDNEFKYGFNNFVEYNAHLLFFVTIALIVYDYFKKNKSI